MIMTPPFLCHHIINQGVKVQPLLGDRAPPPPPWQWTGSSGALKSEKEQRKRAKFYVRSCQSELLLSCSLLKSSGSGACDQTSRARRLRRGQTLCLTIIPRGRSRSDAAVQLPPPAHVQAPPPSASPVCKHTAPHVNDELICLPTPPTFLCVEKNLFCACDAC